MRRHTDRLDPLLHDACDAAGLPQQCRHSSRRIHTGNSCSTSAGRRLTPARAPVLPEAHPLGTLHSGHLRPPSHTTRARPGDDLRRLIEAIEAHAAKLTVLDACPLSRCERSLRCVGPGGSSGATVSSIGPTAGTQASMPTSRPLLPRNAKKRDASAGASRRRVSHSRPASARTR